VKQNNTAQRPYRKHKKHTEDNGVQDMQKTIKLTENTNIRKVIAIHWREASGGQQRGLMHWGWLK